jgi:hypothetical protein
MKESALHGEVWFFYLCSSSRRITLPQLTSNPNPIIRLHFYWFLEAEEVGGMSEALSLSSDSNYQSPNFMRSFARISRLPLSYRILQRACFQRFISDAPSTALSFSSPIVNPS